MKIQFSWWEKMTYSVYNVYNVSINKNKAMECAIYIINYCNHRGYYIDRYRLGPYLFYAQANHLFKFEKPLFEDDILATEYGARVKSVDEQFAIYGSAIIPSISYTMELNEETWGYKPKDWEINLTHEETDTLDSVAEHFKDYGVVGIWEGMGKQTPWIKARKRKDKKVNNMDLLCFFKYS